MTHDAAPLLALQGISRRFGGTVALDGASLDVRAGRVHALLGENGAGKTTLMRIAFGLVAPDAGEVRLAGAPARIASPAEAIARGIGMVHQHFTLIPEMSVAENIALGARGRFDRARIEARIAEISRMSRLAVDPRALVATLTVAEQQRVEIVKALYRSARVLILDEPTGVLAPAEADELLRWLRDFVARGNAAVLITHKLGEAMAVADDVTVLRHGRVAASGPSHALTMGALTSAMLGERTPAPDVTRARASRSGDAAVAVLDRVTAATARERLQDVTVTIRAGQIVGIAAVEGSGQHLLMRVLARRAPVRHGRVALPDAIGFIPEDRHRDGVILDFPLAENIALHGAGGRRGRMDWRWWRGQAAALVKAYDVRGIPPGADPGRVPARALSGGNQQKLVLGREMAMRPQLLVAENPTRGLDIRATAAVHDRLRAAAASGTAVVFYSADLDEVLDLADVVVVVHDGRVKECVVDRESVGRAMLGIA